MNRAVMMQGTRGALVVLASAVVLAACAGENLFTGPATGGGSGPQVDITSPSSGAAVPLGEALEVSASVTAQQGAASAEFKGVYEGDGDAAYAATSQDLNGIVNLTLTQSLTASADQRAGTAVIIVSITDQGGETGADSVTVNIEN